MIPKKIHYCWFGGNKLPADVKKCIKSWKKYCPDYEIIEWNESNFDIDCHPFVRSAYDAKAWAFVSDYARLKVIYDHGGIYFDTDVELLKNIDFLLENKFYIGVQQCELLCTTGLGYGAEKNNLLVEKMLMEYDGLKYSKDSMTQLACPYLNSKVMKEFGYEYSQEQVNNNGILVLPPKFFDPIAPGNFPNLLCNETISIHHYSASWTSTTNRLRRKVIRMIGDKNIEILKNIKNHKRKDL